MKYKIISLPEDIADNLERALLRGIISLKHDFTNTTEIIEQKLILGAEYVLINFLNDLKNSRIFEEPKKEESIVAETVAAGITDYSLNETVKELGLIFKAINKNDICFAFKKQQSLTQNELQEVADSAHRLLTDSDVPEIKHFVKTKNVRIV